MKGNIKSLGKVCITCEGIWNISKSYEKLSLVYDEITNNSYLSKIDVPKNTLITNDYYWQKFIINNNNDDENSDNNNTNSTYHLNVKLDESITYIISEKTFINLINAINTNKLITLGDNTKIVPSYSSIDKDGNITLISQYNEINADNNMRLYYYIATIKRSNYSLTSVYREILTSDNSIPIIELSTIDELFK